MLHAPTSDLICFSHLRWDFVYQRPQHLMSRAANCRRVFFVEEPLPAMEFKLELRHESPNLYVVVPHLPVTLTTTDTAAVMRVLLEEFCAAYAIVDYSIWYYSPMFLPWATSLTPRLVIYDCMDELSMFDFAPTTLGEYELALLAQADVVFTGGMSLYESKRSLHPRVHCFPSSIDQAHFRQARQSQPTPADQLDIPRPRLGFAGVIDERMDLHLLETLADKRPEWHLVLVGPIVKVDPACLPHRPNIHYLGMKPYASLPGYMAGWDAGLVPFALNNATRFISPTKTPEYLAAGLPVVSTAIRDVVATYGAAGLVQLWENPDDLVSPVEQALFQGIEPGWRQRVDDFLAPMAWDTTWSAMEEQMNALLFQNG